MRWLYWNEEQIIEQLSQELPYMVLVLVDWIDYSPSLSFPLFLISIFVSPACFTRNVCVVFLTLFQFVGLQTFL